MTRRASVPSVRRRHRLRLAAGALLALLVGGCATEQAGVPVECKSGRGALRAALERAPRPVRVEGRPLSQCFTTASNSADIAEVGEEYLAVASGLAEDARAEPEGAAALRLGYLVGAVRRGAAATQGTNDEMLRRVEQELTLVNARTPAFRRGERAGRAEG